MNIGQLNKALNIIDDSLTPTEARELIIKSIDKQINNYKLKSLSRWIGDHDFDQSEYDRKIQQLQDKKKELQEVILEARSSTSKIKVTNNIEITVDKLINQ